MLEIKIENVNCQLAGEIDQKSVKELSDMLSYDHQGYNFMSGGRGGFGMQGKYGGWDGKVRLLQKSGKFPIGLLGMVRSFLDEKGFEYSVVDNRPTIKYGQPVTQKNSDFEPRAYQLNAVKTAHSKGSGIIKVATGGGKSFIISSIVAKYNIPTIVYVIGIELLHQMKKTIESAYGIECGIVGGGECDVSKEVTIMTIWSAASAFNKKVKITDNDTTLDSKKHINALNKAMVRKKVQEAQLFIFDECQYAASETLQFLHRASVSAKHRFLFSGTPWRDTGDDILIEAVSGPKIVDINATYLIKNDYLVKPKIYFLDVPVMRGVGKNYHDVYKNYIVENDDRNDLIIKSARKLVKEGKKVLILVVRVSHGDVLMEKLSDEFRVKFLDGAKSSKMRMDSIQEMKDGELDILIASKIFDQGVDIPELDALILAGSGKSSGRALQRIGRVIRKSKGKEAAIVVEFFDNCKYLRDHSEARIKVYKSEPGFDIKIQKNKALKSYPKKAPVKWA
jgi:superfamily II DNA or RNA helicase